MPSVKVKENLMARMILFGLWLFSFTNIYAFTGIKINCNVPEAIVFADGIYVGNVGSKIPLEQGSYQITVSADGYEPITKSLKVIDSQIKVFKVVLKKDDVIIEEEDLLLNGVRKRGTSVDIGLGIRQSKEEEVAKKEGDPALAFLPFGVGQFQNGHNIKGTLVLIMQLAGLGLGSYGLISQIK